MGQSLTHFILATPVLAIFLCLGIGYWIGKIKLGSFMLGSTVGVLLTALLIGQIGVFTIDPVVKDIFFDFFIFAIGYEVGPAFFNSFKKTGIKLIIQSCFFGLVAFGLAILLFKLFKVAPGTGAGIVAGSLTQSAAIGTATTAVDQLPISASLKADYLSQTAVAYALTYVFGTAGVVVFLKNVAPIILRTDLKVEVPQLAQQLQATNTQTMTKGLEKEVVETNVSYLGIGIVLGILLGTITIAIKGIPITLGTGGGSLFVGLFFGWYQQKHSKIGGIPIATRWFMKSVGLNLFIAVVGLQAGTRFMPALKTMGWRVVAIGILVAILPHLLTLWFGKYVLRLNPVDNLGSLSGAGTITAALNALNEENNTSLFALSYTPAYAVGNITLTLMGSLVIAFLH